MLNYDLTQPNLGWLDCAQQLFNITEYMGANNKR